jgi:hypothetical protein
MKMLAFRLPVSMWAAPILLLARRDRCRSGSTRQRLGSGRPCRVEQQMASVATP